jgi:hypothetical protein
VKTRNWTTEFLKIQNVGRVFLENSENKVHNYKESAVCALENGDTMGEWIFFYF